MSVIEPSWEFRLYVSDPSRPLDFDTIIDGQLRGYTVDEGRVVLELVTPARVWYGPPAVPTVAAVLDTDDVLGPVVPPEPAIPTDSYRLAGDPPWGQVVVPERYLAETQRPEAAASDIREELSQRARADLAADQADPWAEFWETAVREQAAFNERQRAARGGQPAVYRRHGVTAGRSRDRT